MYMENKVCNYMLKKIHLVLNVLLGYVIAYSYCLSTVDEIMSVSIGSVNHENIYLSECNLELFILILSSYQLKE